jgi:hypothetical protein
VCFACGEEAHDADVAVCGSAASPVLSPSGEPLHYAVSAPLLDAVVRSLRETLGPPDDHGAREGKYAVVCTRDASQDVTVHSTLACARAQAEKEARECSAALVAFESETTDLQLPNGDPCALAVATILPGRHCSACPACRSQAASAVDAAVKVGHLATAALEAAVATKARASEALAQLSSLTQQRYQAVLEAESQLAAAKAALADATAKVTQATESHRAQGEVAHRVKRVLGALPPSR